MRKRRGKFLHETVELNITAFLNLMVILVPFLLITAVFSRMSVLELSLPPLDSKQNPEEKIDLQLQLYLYPDQLEVRDATLGRLKSFSLEQGSIDWIPVTKLLLEIKSRFPAETSVALLFDKRVPYKRLIEVMDHVRSTDVVNVGTLEERELFPDVSIGEAPLRKKEPSIQQDLSLESLSGELNEGAGQQQEIEAQNMTAELPE